jgi:hypothetical protein
MSKSILASELFALSQSSRNEGDFECHWCSSKCRNYFRHDDSPIVVGRRSTTTAKRPANAYICAGCWLWRRTSVTVDHMNGSQTDRQQAKKWPWLITSEKAMGIKSPDDFKALYEFLLAPVNTYVLALLEGDVENQLQLMEVNDIAEIRGETKMVFTLNNIPHYYSVYELESAIKHGADGKEPGVAALIRLLGEYDLEEEEVKKRGRGRPPKAEQVDETRALKKVIRPQTK